MNSRKLVNTVSPFPTFHGIPEGLNVSNENEELHKIVDDISEVVSEQKETKIPNIDDQNRMDSEKINSTTQKFDNSSPNVPFETKEEVIELDKPQEQPKVEINQEPQPFIVEELPKKEENTFKVHRLSTPFPKGLEEEINEETPLKIIPTKKKNYFKSFITECPHCKKTVKTDCKRVLGSFPFIGCLSFTGIGFILGLCLIPFMILSFYDIVHICPDCHKEICRISPVDF